MHTVIEIVGLFAVVAIVRELARRTGSQSPILLLVTGIGLSFIPGLPPYRLSPNLVLHVVLPVLLYAAAFTASVPAFRRNVRSIGMLSVGLTLFTTVVVGYVAYTVVPGLPLAAALVLGAVVAPPDAVAAMTIGRKAGMPRRVVTILEGESLFNDAAALTAFQVTVAAAVTGSIGMLTVAGQFAIAAVGGLVIGGVVAVLLGWLRKYINHPLSDTALSLIAPFIGYIPAELAHASGLVSTVVVGLYLGHRAPSVMDASARLITRSVWQVIEYLVAGAVFVLIGLQVADVVAGLGDYSIGTLAAASAAVLAAMVLSRAAWMFPSAYLPRLLSTRLRRRERPVPWQEPAIASWSGLRGVVSLGAAFAIPMTVQSGAPFPKRDLVLFLTIVAIVVTTLGHGLTLPGVVRTLRTSSSESTHDAEQEAAAHHKTAAAGMRKLDELLEREQPPERVVERLRERADRRRWLAEQHEAGEHDRETPSAAYRRLRRAMLAATRDRLVRMRDDGEIDEEVFTDIEHELDLEESILHGGSTAESNG